MLVTFRGLDLGLNYKAKGYSLPVHVDIIL